MSTRMFTFVGGDIGLWRIVRMTTISGDPLPVVPRLTAIGGSTDSVISDAKWFLRGITSNERYVTRQEKDQLTAKQPAIGRPEAVCAALFLSERMPCGGRCRRMNVEGFLRRVPGMSR